MRQNPMTSNGRVFGLAMGDWFTLLAGCFAAIALASLLVYGHFSDVLSRIIVGGGDEPSNRVED
jgi:hypothetical protein